jgi:hypothetical protein
MTPTSNAPTHSDVCPACGKAAMETVLLLADKATRRCDHCRVEQIISLPPLNKKIFYLDQNAVSNLAHTRHATGKSAGSIWGELNGQLSRAVRRQLVVCPGSFNHQIESAVATHFEAFMKTAGYFAGTCSFFDFEGIRSHQIRRCFSAYLEGAPQMPVRLQATDVTQVNPHGWLPIPMLIPLWRMSKEEINQLRSVREAAYRDVSDVSAFWKANANRTIEEWKDREIPGARHYGKLLTPSLPQLSLRYDRDIGIITKAALEFVTSSAFAEVPYVKISSWLYATAAKKAASQKEPPSRGFLADVEAIACLLPYCDAMLLDNECRAYLDELRRAGRLVFDALIFSKSNMAALIPYLNDLEKNARSEIVSLAEELYT